MRLTEKQEQLITRYLRDVGNRLDGMSDGARDLATSQVRLRVMQRLRRMDKSTPDDADVVQAIADCGTPAEQAERFLSKQADTSADKPRVSTPECRWLGVCAALADLTGLTPTMVRVAAVILGLITGPFALIAYLIAYTGLRFTVMDAPAPVRKLHLAGAIARTVAVAAIFYGFARALLWFTYYAYFHFTQEALVLTAKWNWYEDRQGSWLFWILMFTLPLAILSGLPVPKPWSGTLRKLAQACMAVYAVLLTFAVACVIAGAVILAVQNYGHPIDVQSMVTGL